MLNAFSRRILTAVLCAPFYQPAVAQLSASEDAKTASESTKKPGRLTLSVAAANLEDDKPALRMLPSPLNSPPFPSSDFAGPLSGAPDSTSEYALTKLLNRTRIGDVLKENRIRGRVALGGCPPKAPTDPDVRDSRIRLVTGWFRCACGVDRRVFDAAPSGRPPAAGGESGSTRG